MDDVGVAFEVEIELGMKRAPMDELVVGFVIAPADHDGLAPVGMAHERGKEIEMVVGPIAAGGQEDGEKVGLQFELLDAKLGAFFRGGEDLNVGTRMHEMAAHAGFFPRKTFFHGVIAGRGCARNVEINRRLDPVDGVAPAAGELAAKGGAADVVRAEDFPRKLEVAAVEAVVHAKNEMRAVLAQHFLVIGAAEGDVVAVDEAEQLNQ